MSSGIEILLSTICMNLTECFLDPVPPPYFYGYDQSNKSTEYAKIAEQYNGKHLKIGSIENFPLSYMERSDNNTIVGRGAAFDLIEILRWRFNFTYEIILPDTNMEFSQENAEASLVTMLLNKEIDMIGAFLPILPDLTRNITYSTSLDEAEWLIMMKRPMESATGSGLLAPFTSQVWYLILVAVITFGPFIYILTWLRYLMTKDVTNKPYKLGPCVWFVYGGLIKQGTSLSPEANSTRILFATWWIFITLLSAFYTANLTAFLTLSKFTLSINEPKDLLVKNKKWIARKGSNFDYVVKSPKEELFILSQMLTTKKGIFEVIRNDSEVLPYVEKNFVFIRDKPAVQLLMYEDYKRKTQRKIEEKLRCTFVVTLKPFMKNARAFAYPQKSTLATLFDTVLLRIVEAGIVKYKTNEELPGNQICPLNLKSSERRLRNADLQMTYFLAGIGIATAAIALCIEVTYRYRDKLCVSSLIKKTATFDEKMNTKNRPVGQWSPGPPPYQTIFGQPYGMTDSVNNKIKNVNGRDYWVVQLPTGDSRLIPVRTPSAFLFQYST